MTTTVTLQVQNIHPDRTQYKKYDVTFTPAPERKVMVQVEIEDNNVVFVGDDYITIKPDGLAQMCDVIATAYEKNYNEYVQRKD